jgi:hypothetical protein
MSLRALKSHPPEARSYARCHRAVTASSSSSSSTMGWASPTRPRERGSQLGVYQAEQEQGDPPDQPRDPAGGTRDGGDQTRGEQPSRTDNRANPDQRHVHQGHLFSEPSLPPTFHHPVLPLASDSARGLDLPVNTAMCMRLGLRSAERYSALGPPRNRTTLSRVTHRLLHLPKYYITTVETVKRGPVAAAASAFGARVGTRLRRFRSWAGC